MSKTITGAALIAFYADDAAWPENSYQDDTEFLHNGVKVTELPDLKPDDQVEILDGYVYAEDPDKDPISLKTYFKRWEKKQNEVRWVISFDREKEAPVRAALSTLGVKVN